MFDEKSKEEKALLDSIAERVQAANRKVDRAGVVSDKYHSKLYSIARIVLGGDIPAEQEIRELEQLADLLTS